MRRSPATDRLRRAFASPYLLLTLTMLMWGGNSVAGRLAVGEISPLALTALRWLVVGAVMGVACRRALVDYWPALRPRVGYLVFMGIIGFTSYNALYYWAAHTTTALNINIVSASLPAMILIGAVVAFHQKVRATQWLGVAVSILGVAIAAAHGRLETLRDFAFNFGDGLILVATACYAVYSLNLRLRPAVPAIVFFAAIVPAAALSALVLYGVEIASGAFRWPTLQGWLVLGYVAIFPSLIAQIFFIRGVELIGAGRAGLFANLMPVFGAALSTIVLGEAFELYHAVALALTIGGIVLAELRQPRPAPAADRP
jgi:drug/metabolite transporter (DMT)-like permease